MDAREQRRMALWSHVFEAVAVDLGTTVANRNAEAAVTYFDKQFPVDTDGPHVAKNIDGSTITRTDEPVANIVFTFPQEEARKVLRAVRGCPTRDWMDPLETRAVRHFLIALGDALGDTDA